MINHYPTTRMPVPFTPYGRGAGLIERRVRLYTQINLTEVVGLIGDYNHYVDDDIWLDDAATAHDNHASDPGVSAITLTQSAGFNWSRSRALSEALTLSDYAHAYLLGLGGGGSGGDPDLSKHTVTFDSTMVTGQPVYVSGNNSVDAAIANDIVMSEVVGLVLTGATAGNQGVILTEGSVTNLDWTPVAGSASLTPAATYYLSDTTAGILTSAAPTLRGRYVVRVGKALSTTVMDIEIAVDLLL